ncbi:MAG: prepilin-type N-terminal cleavage/methylation domain-containing protein [Patescibacteria group bacterium]
MVNKLRAVMDKKSGFTLMELLIVIAIIAILTVAFLPGALKAPAKARDAGKIKTVNDIVILVESWMAEKGTPPASSAGVPYCLEPAKVPPAFLTSFKETPTDKQKLGSCSAPADTEYFFYKYLAPAASAPFYVVAARVELGASANSSATRALLEGAATGDAAKAFITNGIASATPYYMAVGPM